MEKENNIDLNQPVTKKYLGEYTEEVLLPAIEDLLEDKADKRDLAEVKTDLAEVKTDLAEVKKTLGIISTKVIALEYNQKNFITKEYFDKKLDNFLNRQDKIVKAVLRKQDEDVAHAAEHKRINSILEKIVKKLGISLIAQPV